MALVGGLLAVFVLWLSEEYAAGVFIALSTDFCLYGFQLLLRFWYHYQ